MSGISGYMYRLPNHDLKMTHMLFSRGCQYRCYYCAAGGGKIRYRSPENIVKELTNIKHDQGIQGFSIIDDCFLTNKNNAISICKEIKNLNLKWSLAARADQIDEAVLDCLAESGCVEIKMGLDTGSDLLLEKMNKRHNVQDIRKALNLINQRGIFVKAFIISCLPGETKETNKITKDFLTEMQKKIQRVALLKFAPLPGSYIYQYPKDFGINPEPINEDNFSQIHLYRSEANWWAGTNEDTAEGIYKRYKEIYDDMKKFVHGKWKESFDEENIPGGSSNR